MIKGMKKSEFIDGDGFMSSTPVTRTPGGQPPETLEDRFRELAEEWHKAVAYHSSSTVRSNHPAYQEIIKLGPEVVPLLLRDMEANHTHWFTALRRITGADPVPESAAGNVPKMVGAWLDWAKDKFANEQGIPQHAARLQPNGKWTSKLGELQDIEHRLRDLEGEVYGSVVLVMKRPVPPVDSENSEGPDESPVS